MTLSEMIQMRKGVSGEESIPRRTPQQVIQLQRLLRLIQNYPRAISGRRLIR